MLYLLDANVLIRAHEDYYPIDRVPQFWDWLLKVADAGHVKMPFEIHDEIAISNGPLKDWICEAEAKKKLILDEQVSKDLLHKVLSIGYAPDLTDSELEMVGRDPFLISYALVTADRVVVTKEVSKPSKQRANRKVPDVCNSVGAAWMKDFEFFRAMNFNTSTK
ncbi:DNA-binding protein [Niveispirillum lacus]|uniref:DNA-binding protein n=1 Tax=Niveispirillum lacus TaxID=1981099 RepID=A0A255Z7A0_9PROT|nr:DUF4411 family protein [Niveispirillum lacus]OYQ36520.1 DNA-binding protein [Niveispirillum lacus]